MIPNYQKEKKRKNIYWTCGKRKKGNVVKYAVLFKKWHQDFNLNIENILFYL
jgi:hypothetical protein